MSSQKIKAAPVSQEVSTIIPFTAIVVTYNEEARLRDCLESLSFCNQLVVVDLGSEDQSVEIAESYGAEVFHHERVPVVEHIRQDALKYARYEWVVFLDPDEVFPSSTVEDIRLKIRNTPDCGKVILPLKFYFKGVQLKGTRWGGVKQFGRLMHRERCMLTSDVHRGVELSDSYTSVKVALQERHVRHYWVDSWNELFEKHTRYLRHEGESLYNSGERFTWARWFVEPLQALKYSLISKHGWRDGWVGIFLSFFWAWYVSMRLLALRRYENSIEAAA
jgi:glycosyltransferase involved in cell wall biosynthesis